MTWDAALPEPKGVAVGMQPLCPINLTTESFWTIVANVNTALKKKGFHTAAQEFRTYVDKMDGDTGWLYMIALAFVRTSEEDHRAE